MEKRRDENSGEHISLLGFGCMRLPLTKGSTSAIKRDEAFAMVDYAMANGVNYYDTAYNYHASASESFIGEALKKYRRENFKLATKMPPWLVKKKSDIERIFNEQLEKCQVEYFDYYLIHCINESNWANAEKHGIYEFLNAKKSGGEIRHLGFSFHDKPPLMEKVIAAYPWDFAQIQFNYMDYDLQQAEALYNALSLNNIPVIVMEPVRGGVLAELTPEAGEIFKKADAALSLASWALRYAASPPDVLTVLSGMSNMEQLKDNINTFSPFKPLTERENAIIAEALSIYRSTAAIPCTACGYCMPCPFGVDIPKVFALYNNYRVEKNLVSYSMSNQVLGREKQAANCTACQKCVSLCPQSIDIPASMNEIKALLKN
jgi:predicted aldo/keto reductase-like oxidoreductase